METEIKLSFPDKEELFSVIEAEWFSDYCLDTSPKKAVLLEERSISSDKKIRERR